MNFTYILLCVTRLWWAKKKFLLWKLLKIDFTVLDNCIISSFYILYYIWRTWTTYYEHIMNSPVPLWNTPQGNISQQDAVSMIAPLLLDVQPHHKVSISSFDESRVKSLLTLSLPVYHCRQWKSWRIYTSPVTKGLNTLLCTYFERRLCIHCVCQFVRTPSR